MRKIPLSDSRHPNYVQSKSDMSMELYLKKFENSPYALTVKTKTKSNFATSMNSKSASAIEAAAAAVIIKYNFFLIYYLREHRHLQ